MDFTIIKLFFIKIENAILQEKIADTVTANLNAAATAAVTAAVISTVTPALTSMAA